MTMGLQDIEYGHENEHLVELLESVDRPGDYCIGDRLYVPMPRVTVDGVGELSFPVPVTQIDALIEAAERAPYGKGTRTLVDTAVRDCWQIDADRIRLGGRAWSATLQKVMDLVTAGLGLADANLGVKLYKLLIYRQGGFFAAHRDSEKVAGMVATLSLTLPTQGAGGELVIRHGDSETVFDMRAQEPSELTFAAFYADCLHEARPVTEGHRISLVFNLFIRSGKKWTGAPDYTGLTEEVKACLAAWRDNGTTDKLVWLLDHAYSEDGLSFDTLKNTDAAVARVLAEAADGADCGMHAAVLYIEEMGEPELDFEPGPRGMEATEGTEMEHLIERREYLDNWVALDGSRPPLGELSLGDGELHPPGALEDAQPDEELLEEYQGNYGPTLEHIYRLAALVVWPKAKTVDVVAGAGIKHAVSWAATQHGLVSGAEMRRILVRLADLWPAKSDGYQDHNRAEMLRLLGANGDADLATHFLEQTVLDHYDGSENASLAGLISFVGPATASRFLPQLVEKYISLRPKEIVSLLALAGEKAGKGGPAWRDVERNVARIALSSLRAVLEAADALAHAEAYRLSGEKTGYINPAVVEQQNMDQAAIRDLFALARRLGLAEESVQAARTIADFPKAVKPDRTLPAALAGLYKHEGMGSTEAYRLLWRQAADFLLGRSSAPPGEPADWTIKAEWPCSCELCSRLRAFCRDPAARVMRFKAAKEVRKYLHRIIDGHRLDMEHVTDRVGRPYTLVCTKNRASYKRRLREYAEDVRCIALLLELEPAGEAGKSDAERVRRLKRAEAAGRRN